MEHNISKLYLISQASKFLGVHPDTLRRWEKLGLLKPIRNPMNKYRLYTLESLQRVLTRLYQDE